MKEKTLQIKEHSRSIALFKRKIRLLNAKLENSYQYQAAKDMRNQILDIDRENEIRKEEAKVIKSQNNI